MRFLRKFLCLGTFCVPRMSGRAIFEDCFTSDFRFFDGTKHQYSYMIPSIHFKSPANFNGIQVLRLPAMVVFVFKWYRLPGPKTVGQPEIFEHIKV